MSSSPIMVKFGTNDGPIVPAPSTTTTTPAPGAYTMRPAPVYETPDDIPNPRVYKPLDPHQYRKQIYKYKPNPNLILGTPLDQKYTGRSKNTDYYQKEARDLGIDYKGPQTFGHQQYEREYEKNNNYNKIDSRQDEFNFRNHPRDQDNTATRTVPQIGIVYSSGVRYYVPQRMYYDDIDNSVYQANDLKYYYHNQPQQHSQNQYPNNYY